MGEVFLLWGLLPSWINTQLQSSLLLSCLFRSLSAPLCFWADVCSSFSGCAPVPALLHLDAARRCFLYPISSSLVFLWSWRQYAVQSLFSVTYTLDIVFISILHFHFQDFKVVPSHPFLFLFHYPLFLFCGISLLLYVENFNFFKTLFRVCSIIFSLG